MSDKKQVQQEIDLRIEEITLKIKELMKIADANDLNFSLNIVDKEYYCESRVNEDEYLSDYHGEGGQWLSSSDFC